MYNVNSTVNFYLTYDLEKTTHFYTELLGLKQVFEVGRYRIFGDPEKKYFIGFGQKLEEHTINPQGICISFNCPDEETVRKNFELVREHAPVVYEPNELGMLADYNHCYAASVKDPSGYKVEFQYIYNTPCFY